MKDEIENKTKDESLVDNTPNAAVTMYALQNIGYNNDVAICDIVDNSIDAEATNIKIEITKDNDTNDIRILIADNGKGMTYSELNEALRLGSLNSHIDISDLGKFGMGLSTAGLSLADSTTVLTRSKDLDCVLRSSTDIEEIKRTNSFVKTLGTATPDQEKLFNSYLGDNNTGTIVIFDKCKGVKERNVNNFTNKLVKTLSRVFRKFMDKVTFEINGITLRANDPLQVSDPDFPSRIYSDDEYEVKWKDTETGKDMIGNIHVKLVILQDLPDKVNKNITFKEQGFSVLRNNREIAFGFIPESWTKKHPSHNRFRGEISFSSALDVPMGVNFTKNNIDMCDSIFDNFNREIEPQVKQIYKEIDSKARPKNTDDISDNEKLGHKKAAEVIDNNSKRMILPPAEQETRRGSKHRVDPEPKPTEPTPVDPKPRNFNKPKKVIPNVEFLVEDMTESGPIFDSRKKGKTIVIVWNSAHPFYSVFIKENVDNLKLLTAVDFMVYALATAQIQAMSDDEDIEEMMININSIMSTNLRILLS